MSTEGVLGAAWLPTDGYLDPTQLTYALADGARQGGCKIHHQHPGDRDRTCAGTRRRVRTERGDIEAEVVVNAGGMYAAEIGRMAGVRVPMCRCPTSTWSPSPSGSATGRTSPPCATLTCLSTTARTAAAW